MSHARDVIVYIYAGCPLPRWLNQDNRCEYTAYADVDTYVDTYADLKYRCRVSIFSND